MWSLTQHTTQLVWTALAFKLVNLNFFSTHILLKLLVLMPLAIIVYVTRPKFMMAHNNKLLVKIVFMTTHPHLLVRTTSDWFLPALVTPNGSHSLNEL